ncbi:MAG TPA: cytochrome c [Anaerolineales bacterium]
MNKKINFFVGSLLAVGTLMLLSTCASNPPMMKKAATAPAAGAFSSNGERIYFTSSSDRGTPITYSDGPELNGGMMGSGGQLACVSCHGPDGRGGKHNMGMMRLMMAKDIRWSALQSEFDAGKFSLALTKGQDPDGTQLNRDMPRWNIGADDQADLITYLKTLP